MNFFLQMCKTSIIFALEKQTKNFCEMDTMNETMTAKPKKRISKTARWARAHKFMIYEVTDPELRSQLC